MKHIIPALTVIAILLTLAAGYPAQTVSASVLAEEEPPISAPLFPEADVYSSDAPEPKSVITDLFGNTLNNDPAAPPAFIALHTDPAKKLNTNLNFGCVEQPLAFNFSFYERLYTSGQVISICVDGLLAVGPPPNPAFRDFNTTLPFEAEPNNLIAVLWDDLAIDNTAGFETSGIYVNSTASMLVVEWYQLIPAGHNTNRLIFEAILYPTGEIYLLYQTITQPMLSATVGIEDSTGFTGLQYLYNTDGISSGEALHIQRPADPNTPRARFVDGHQSELAYGRKAVFPIAFQNTGTTAQTFALSTMFVSSAAGWNAKLCTTAACLQTITSTGSLAPQQTFNFYLQLSADPLVPVGSRAAVKVKAATAAKTWEALHESAVPAGFSQAFADSTGLSQLLVWDTNIFRSQFSNHYPGANMSLVAGKDLTLFAWEWQGTATSGAAYTSIMVSTLNQFGQVIDSPALIQDHPLVTVATRDQYPNLAVASNGTLAAVFKRERFKFEGQPCYNDNIMISWKQAGQVWQTPLKLTSNGDEAWRCLANEAPGYSFPRIIALPDNRFAVTWMEQRRRDGTDYSNLRVWVFDPNAPQAPTDQQGYPLTEVNYLQYEYFSPTLVAKDNGIVLFYVLKNNSLAENPIYYAVLESNGTQTTKWGKIDYSNSDNSVKIDAALMSSGKIALVWKDYLSLQVTYTILNTDYVTAKPMPTALLESHILQADTISVAATKDGRAVVTWGDYKWQRALAYALVDSYAEIITAPILFSHTSATNPVVQTSTNGQGVSTYEGSYRNYAPVVGR